MSVINSQPLIGASGNQGAAYNLTRSLRFRSSASAWLSRTPASTTNQQKYTLSTWVKRGQLGAYQDILDSYVSTNNIELIRFFNDDTFELELFQGSFTYQLKTTQVFRDPSAWYHIVVAYDTTQATASNRIKVYVNGVQVTSFSTSTYPSQNANLFINRNVAHSIGVNLNNGNNSYFDGYLAEFNFIDGQQLDASSFGETDTATGVWKPKKYTGTYGTNGYYLKFDNLTSTSTLGNDSSGNGNNWTVNNISLTSGATYDSMKDVPTLTDADTANYCTLNPLSATSGTFSRANLRYVGPSSDRRANGTMAVSTGKWYWEVTLGNAPFSPRSNSTQYNSFGFGVSTAFASTTGPTTLTDAVILTDAGFYKNFSGSYTDGGTAFSSGDVLSIAVDLDANTYTFYRNNSQLVTGTIGGTAGRELVPVIISYNGDFGVMDANFGQRPFAYTPPSGFKALNTFNLPTPTIGATATTQANKYFDATLWSGDDTNPRAITNSGGFQPDLVWVKARNSTQIHVLNDSVRGAGTAYGLVSNTTDLEGTANLGLYGAVTAFNSNGFSVGGGTNNQAQVNYSTFTYVGWQWKAGGTSVSNTAGTITSTVNANTSTGFSIITYSGNGTNGATVGHGLGVTPSMIIIKGRNSSTGSSNWLVEHSGISSSIQANSTTFTTTGTNLLVLNTTDSTVSYGFDAQMNGSGGTYVAYCFAEVAGYSKFGSYTGNGSTDGPFIYTGFRPRFYLYKRTDTTASWVILDAQRNTANIVTNILAPNLTNAESSFDMVDFCSNGIKIRNNFNADNGSGGTFIYAAFAENPFKYSLAR